MPASGTRYERATTFGALDSTALAEGRAEDAFLCREVARNSNRLYSAGGPMLSLVWNSYLLATDDVRGVMADFGAYPNWHRLYGVPLIGPHQPQLRTARVDVVANITNASITHMQIGTSAVPFRPKARAGDENVFQLTATGSYATTSYSGLILGGADLETFDIGILAEPDTDLAGLTGTVTGTVDDAGPYGITDSGAAFDPLGSFRGYYVAFYDSAGALITSPKLIGAMYSTTLAFNNPHKLTDYEVKAVIDQTYEIWEGAPSFQLASITITEETDSAV